MGTKRLVNKYLARPDKLSTVANSSVKQPLGMEVRACSLLKSLEGKGIS